MNCITKVLVVETPIQADN